MTPNMDIILLTVVDYFQKSRDYKGISTNILKDRTAIDENELYDNLIDMIHKDMVQIVSSETSDNPHIMRFRPPEKEKQINTLKEPKDNTICVYPTRSIMERVISDDQILFEKPFSKRLMLVEPQLEPVFFETATLDRYANDPRFIFEFGGYSGRVVISSEYYEDENTDERDKIGIQTFGLGFDNNKNRVVVVYLRYLSSLTKEHQQHWNSYVIPSETCKISAPYYNASLLGSWDFTRTIRDAFIEEMKIINSFSKKMSRPHLFINDFAQELPLEFSIFLRPTRKAYQEFVNVLDKMISENIDKDFFKNEIPLEEIKLTAHGKETRIALGTITLLKNWFDKFYRTPEPVSWCDFFKPFKIVRKLRSKGSHNIIKNEYNLIYYNKMSNLLESVYSTLRHTRKLLHKHPFCSDYEIPEWLEKGNFSVIDKVST